ncbi:MAG: hypothetical protein K6F68_08770 [Clostridiales bacterium]|nr:hypothetical protein [Clostridiales bacterium]
MVCQGDGSLDNTSAVAGGVYTKIEVTVRFCQSRCAKGTVLLTTSDPTYSDNKRG